MEKLVQAVAGRMTAGRLLLGVATLLENAKIA